MGEEGFEKEQWDKHVDKMGNQVCEVQSRSLYVRVA